jgi:cytidylate kinase
MGSLLVVTGPPGAGKSTVASALADRMDPSVLVDGDAFFSFLATGRILPWLPESNTQNTVVTEAAGLATGRFVQDYDTVYDGIVGPWFLDRFGRSCSVAELDYVVLLPDVETCWERVRTRPDTQGMHEDATRKMHREFVAASITPSRVISVEAQVDGRADLVTDEVLRRRDAGELRYRVDPTAT